MAEQSNPSNKKIPVAEAVRELAQPFAEQLGLSLWDVRYEKEGAAWYLRIYIDKEGGVTLDDCEALSRALDGPLDESDPVPGPYYLEVWSPGIERHLTRPEHFPPYEGRKIRIKFIRAPQQTGRREVIATLRGYAHGVISVTLEDGRDFSFEKKQASSIQLFEDYESGGFTQE